VSGAGEIQIDYPAQGVGVITLNRPQRLNALTLDMLYEGLPSAVESLENDPEVSVIIVTGAGRGFCAGADLGSGAFELGDALKEHVVRSHRGPWRLHASPKPTIAAVNGPAAGAGLGLALACDIRIGAPTSKYVTSFISMAMVPDFGLTWSLQQAIGSQRAARLLLEGGRLDAGEALALGLISSISDDALESAVELGGRIAQTPAAACLTKAALRDASARGLHATLFEIEPAAQFTAMTSAEFEERFAAYRATIMGS
jgi:enoyl-CoA hydratase/carnithine racemase